MELLNYLTNCMKSILIPKVLVPKNCRQDFTNKRRLIHLNSSDQIDVTQPKRLCSCTSSFQWKENCLFCGNFAKFDARHPERNKVHMVTILTMHQKLLECCRKRGTVVIRSRKSSS